MSLDRTPNSNGLGKGGSKVYTKVVEKKHAPVATMLTEPVESPRITRNRERAAYRHRSYPEYKPEPETIFEHAVRALSTAYYVAKCELVKAAGFPPGVTGLIHGYNDPYLDAIPDLVSDSRAMETLKSNLQHYRQSGSRPIVLLFYSDHDIEPYRHFLDKIVPDGWTEPLGTEILYASSSEAESGNVFGEIPDPDHPGEMLELDDDDVAEMKGWKFISRADSAGGCWYVRANSKVVYKLRPNETLLIEIVLGGVKYVLANTFGRYDYRKLNAEICGEGKSCDHGTIITYYYRTDKAVSEGWYADSKNSWVWDKSGAYQEPSSFRDLLLCMGQAYAPNKSLWDAMMHGDGWGYGLDNPWKPEDEPMSEASERDDDGDSAEAACKKQKLVHSVDCV